MIKHLEENFLLFYYFLNFPATISLIIQWPVPCNNINVIRDASTWKKSWTYSLFTLSTLTIYFDRGSCRFTKDCIFCMIWHSVEPKHTAMWAESNNNDGVCAFTPVCRMSQMQILTFL